MVSLCQICLTLCNSHELQLFCDVRPNLVLEKQNQNRKLDLRNTVTILKTR